MQFVSQSNLQNALLHHLARVSIRDRLRFGSDKLRMHDFEIAQLILQIVQIDKSRTTLRLSIKLW